MFERFTDRARRVVVLAQEEARLLNHNYIGTEHLLLGMIHEGEGVAAKALEALGISLEGVRADVEALVGTNIKAQVSGHIPFTPRAKKVLELSLREALQLGHNYIGTEHILLGLVREGEGLAAQVLTKRGADLSRIRQQVIQLLSGYGSAGGGGGGQGRTTTHTPAGSRVLDEARRIAGGRPVGTHHLLLALLADTDSLANQALAGLGVNRQVVEAQLAPLDASGTSDELPEDAGARRTTVQLIGDRVAVVMDDLDLKRRLGAALGRMGRDVVLRGTDPGASGFPRLWKALHPALSDAIRQIEREAVASAAPADWHPPDWHPPEWDRGWAVAAYMVAAGPGLRGHLEVAEGVDLERVRAGLADWFMANQPTGPGGQIPCNYIAVLVDRADDPESWGTVTGDHWGVREDWPHRLPRSLLVAHAIVELSTSGP